jgi:hypothetical protein
VDKAEAKKIISEQLLRFRNYADLVPLVESRHVESLEVCGPSGTAYQVEVNFFWDDRGRRIIRVVGSIDDGGIRAYIPLTETLLILPRETSEA